MQNVIVPNENVTKRKNVTVLLRFVTSTLCAVTFSYSYIKRRLRYVILRFVAVPIIWFAIYNQRDIKMDDSLDSGVLKTINLSLKILTKVKDSYKLYKNRRRFSCYFRKYGKGSDAKLYTRKPYTS